MKKLPDPMKNLDPTKRKNQGPQKSEMSDLERFQYNILQDQKKKQQKAEAAQAAQAAAEAQAKQVAAAQQQQREAQITNAVEQARFGAGDAARRQLAERMVAGDEQMQSRGLLYGGLAQRGRDEAQAQAVSNLAAKNAEIRGVGSDLLKDSRDAAFSGLAQDTENKFEGAQDRLNRRLGKSREAQQNAADLGAGFGSLAGIAAESLTAKK